MKKRFKKIVSRIPEKKTLIANASSSSSPNSKTTNTTASSSSPNSITTATTTNFTKHRKIYEKITKTIPELFKSPLIKKVLFFTSIISMSTFMNPLIIYVFELDTTLSEVIKETKNYLSKSDLILAVDEKTTTYNENILESYKKFIKQIVGEINKWLKSLKYCKPNLIKIVSDETDISYWLVNIGEKNENFQNITVTDDNIEKWFKEQSIINQKDLLSQEFVTQEACAEAQKQVDSYKTRRHIIITIAVIIALCILAPVLPDLTYKK